MRLTAVLLTFAFVQVFASVEGQTIRISANNLPLKQIFEEIKEQTGFAYFGNNRLLDYAQPVTIHVEDMPMLSFLELLLHEQSISFSIAKNTILLSEKKVKTTFYEEVVLPIRGLVLDADGNPLAGATVEVKNKKVSTTTNNDGDFALSAEIGDVLLISFVGFEKREFTIKNADKISIQLTRSETDMEDVEVVINTGYQKLKPNEMAGAVDVITKKMLMEQTGNTVMERLVGMSGSLNFTNKTLPGSTTSNPNSVLNMTIRGYSTISGTTDPLIIVNNFPYTGDIDNLDPNDIESIVILKDAAATAMWGIRAANGVIVITTSGSKFKQKTKISFRSTTTVTPEPNLDKVDVADGPEVYDYIAQNMAMRPTSTSAFSETRYLGGLYYNMGLIDKEEFDSRLNVLKSLNPRKQWSDLLYKTGVAQAYSLNISGGSENLAWTISGSLNSNNNNLQAKSKRANYRMTTIYKLTDKLNVELGLTYSNTTSKTGAPGYNSISTGVSGNLFRLNVPLANQDGTPYGWWEEDNPIFMDSVGGGLYGDLKYYTLTDWKNDYTKTNLNSYVKAITVKYEPIKDLNISASIQSIDQKQEVNHVSNKDAYFTRFYQAYSAEINRETNIINHVLPSGGFRRIRNNDSKSINARLDLNYKRTFPSGTLLFNSAFDVSESNYLSQGEFLAGYNESPLSYVHLREFGFYSSYLNSYNSTGYVGKNFTRLYIKQLTDPASSIQRNISTTASLSYIYKEKIVLNTNLRRDGANIIGVNVNERWKPNYSAAVNWLVHKERFLDSEILSNLTVGMSYGHVGNVDVSKSSRLVASHQPHYTNSSDLGPYLSVFIPPNPELQWEKTEHLNYKLDIGLFNNRLNINSNYFTKNISDLYANTTVDPVQSLSTQYVANVGKMKVKGYEISIQAKVLKSRINYDITFTTAKTSEKIAYYPTILTPGQRLMGAITSDGNSIAYNNPIYENIPLFAIISIDGEQGVNEVGGYYVNYKGQKFASDGASQYSALSLLQAELMKATDLQGIKVHGTATPKFTGSMHHRISFKRFSLLVSVQAELGHYFKYPTFIVNNMQFTKQFYNTWKEPGDELISKEPKEIVSKGLSDDYSNKNIYKGGVIRVNNIQLNYNLPIKKLQSCNISLNFQNLGKIWTANKEGYDYQNLNIMKYDGPNKYAAFSINIGL